MQPRWRADGEGGGKEDGDLGKPQDWAVRLPMHAAKLAGQRRETGVCHCHQLHENDLMAHGQNASACLLAKSCWWAEED